MENAKHSMIFKASYQITVMCHNYPKRPQHLHDILQSWAITHPPSLRSGNGSDSDFTHFWSGNVQEMAVR